jgi:hypothetical protein
MPTEVSTGRRSTSTGIAACALVRDCNRAYRSVRALHERDGEALA